MFLSHRRIVEVLTLIGSTFVAGNGATFATCSNAVFFGSSGYVYTPGVCPEGAPCPGGTSVTEGAAGSFWAIGFGVPAAGQGVDSGTWPLLEGSDPGSGWLRVFTGQPAYLSGTWGADPRTDACIAPMSCLAVLLSDQVSNQSYFAMLTKREAPGAGYVFDSDILLAPIPRPVVTSGSIHGNTEVVTIRMDAPTAGFVGDGGCPQNVVRGYKVYQRQQPRNAPPPTDLRRSQWTLADGGDGIGGGAIPFGMQAQITIHPFCASWSYSFATSLVFEGGFETAHLSPRIGGSSQIPEWYDDDCDGAQAWYPDGMTVYDCNDGDPSVYPGAPQICDHKNNDCDSPTWPSLEGTNEVGADPDVDSWPGTCDNCPSDPNPSQSDLDSDGLGDACDLADGAIVLGFGDRTLVQWQEEAGFEAWNLYRSSLEVLRATGVYTQAPGSNPIARRDCGIGSPSLLDADAPASGTVALYLVTGLASGIESSLGTDSAGHPRPNANPCP